MADEKQSGGGSGGTGGFIVLMIAAASVVYYGWSNPTLVSTRPTTAERHSQQIEGPQDVYARLWQDPFAAIEQHIEGRKDPDGRHSVDRLRDAALKAKEVL